MTSEANAAAGTFLQYDDGSDNYTTIAEVTNIGGAGLTRDTFSSTYHGGSWQEVVPGLPDGGEINIDLNWLPADATQQQMHTDLTGVVRNYRICFPNYGASTATFTTDFGTDDRLDATHGMLTGEPFRVTTSGALPAGLSADTTYYAAVVSAGEITAHPTSADAVAGTNTVDITDDGTGTQTIQKVTNWILPSLITSLTPTAPVDGKLAATATFKVSDAPTFD